MKKQLKQLLLGSLDLLAISYLKYAAKDTTNNLMKGV